MSGPAASVIVLFDRGAVEPCLSSLLAQTGVDFEIVAVVAPGGKLPESSRIAVMEVADRNPARRRNLAAAKARGRVLAFIDDDAWAAPQWLADGVKLLDDHPDWAGVGGPNLCPPDAGFREQLTDLILTTPYIGAGSRAYRGGGALAPARAGELHLVNLLVRREWFEKAGGLNEALGYGGEDTEFIYQAGRQGAKIYFDPDLTVTHQRRAFGVEYARQRFRLRRQSARLSAAFPEIYASNRAFRLLGWLTGAALVLSVLTIAAGGWAGLAFLLAAYSVLVLALSARGRPARPELLAATPAAFFVHHAVNLAGFYLGWMTARLQGPERVREELGRRRV